METEVTNISSHGLWILSNKKEYFLSYEQFPWFKDKTINDITHVESFGKGHLYWESLDVDLDEINAKVTALKEILGEGDTEDQFLDVIDIVNQLVDAINAVKKNDAYSYLFNSDTGEVTVDLSAYGFDSNDEYDLYHLYLCPLLFLHFLQ